MERKTRVLDRVLAALMIVVMLGSYGNFPVLAAEIQDLNAPQAEDTTVIEQEPFDQAIVPVTETPAPEVLPAEPVEESQPAENSEGEAITEEENVEEISSEANTEETVLTDLPAEESSTDVILSETEIVATEEEDTDAAEEKELPVPETETASLEETEEESYPSQWISTQVGGTVVNVYAPEGALPAGSGVVAKKVDASLVAQAVENAAESSGKGIGNMVAIDVTIVDRDGKEIQPQIPVTVWFTNAGVEGSDISVYHIDDATGSATEVETQIANSTTQKFEADGFSIYVVVEGVDPDARLLVNFYGADGTTLIASMSLTKNQLDAGQMNTNIYDPGVGTMEAGDVFKGWTEKKDFTVDDAETGLDINEVRDKVTALLNAGTVSDGDKIDLYAMIFKSYHISYRDELGVTIYTDEVLYKAGDTSIPYTVEFTYTPYYVTGSDEEDETKAANFSGWAVVDTEEEGIGDIYQNGDKIDMATSGLPISNYTLTLLAQVSYGHWLVFNENGSGVSYTPPLFVGTDSTPAEAKMPAAPTRPGYTFDGWYTSAECTIAFDPTVAITATTNVWAKWIENTKASFTVLVWEEDRTSGYDFVKSIEIEGANTGDIMADYVSATQGASTITVNGQPVFIGLASNPNTANAGFMFDKYEANTEDGKVSSQGTSVLNIYFVRREYTLKFYYARRNGNNYQVSMNYEASTHNRWSGNSTTQPTCSYPTTGTETRSDGYTYYYAALTAKYGSYIGDVWPTYEQFGTLTVRGETYRIGSWAIMNTSQAYIDSGQGTVKGKITIMDEQILGDLSSADGNYVYGNFDTASSQYDWTYHIYFKQEDGSYKLYENVSARSHDSGSNWQTQQHGPAYPGMVLVDKEKIDNRLEINYFYDPQIYNILFMDGLYEDGTHKVLKNNSTNTLDSRQDENGIAYGSDVSTFNTYDPSAKIPDGVDYVFLGWYSDDQCTQKYTFEKMPEGGITVYARWMLKEYMVSLHPQENGDESFKYINGNPAGHYGTNGDVIWVDNGEKVGNVGGTRDLYDLTGWFTNEGLTKVWDFDAFTMNDTIVSKYGELYALDGTDSRYDPAYPGTVGEVNLYASWRRILDGADGINVVYTAVGKDGDGNEVIGTNAPTDPNQYSDQAQAIARPAATAPESEDKLAFQYWVVQKWNGETKAYEDTTQTVFPGDRFKVNFDDAQMGDVVYEEDGTIKSATYTVKLRAQYGSAEDATPTHIYWYDNYTNSVDGILRKDDDLAINQTVTILAAPTRAGYDFLGWARKPETNKDKTETYYVYD
ncbi:MAG: InlB B-repeat-containing protein, partial [Oscillospiraceae bacterium]|nr:InlB B-repeat-containing protein [Oscillospiraceae bacterium]